MHGGKEVETSERTAHVHKPVDFAQVAVRRVVSQASPSRSPRSADGRRPSAEREPRSHGGKETAEE